MENGKMSLTLDEWTSARNRRYLNVNVHSHGKSRSLGLCRVVGSCNAERFVSILDDKLKEYEIFLHTDIAGITTDGASVMKKFGDLLPIESQLCYAHGIHLAVCDVLYKTHDLPLASFTIVEGSGDVEDEEFDEVFTVNEDYDELQVVVKEFSNLAKLLDAVRKVVKLFRKSPTKMEDHFVKHLREEGMNPDLSLLLDCPTRWNSMLTMVERFLKVQLPIEKSFISIKAKERLTFEDWFLLSNIAGCLRPVAIGLTRLCARDANLLTADTVLTATLNRLEKGQDPFSKAVVNALVTRINQRRTIFSDVLQYLDNRSTTVVYSRLKRYAKGDITNVLIKLAKRLSGDSPSISNNSQSEDLIIMDDETESDDDEGRELDDFAEEVDRLLSAQTNTAKNVKTGSENVSIEEKMNRELEFFEDTGHRGDLLELSYRALQTIAATSAEAERNFSIAGRRCNHLRTSLSDASLDALVFLHGFFKSTVT